MRLNGAVCWNSSPKGSEVCRGARIRMREVKRTGVLEVARMSVSGRFDRSYRGETTALEVLERQVR